MQRNTITKLLRRGAPARPYSSTTTTSRFLRAPKSPSIRPSQSLFITKNPARAFSTTLRAPKGLSPESENPQPKTAEDHDVPAAAAELSVEQYNALSDEYMDTLVERLEELQEEREDVDVEYSAGVLTLTFPPIGTYVINKQPPNKQIWLSSPISGPKRYDYVILSEGQNSKEGTGAGQWVYLRDMTTLQGLLEEEVGVDLSLQFTATQGNVDE